MLVQILNAICSLLRRKLRSFIVHISCFHKFIKKWLLNTASPFEHILINIFSAISQQWQTCIHCMPAFGCTMKYMLNTPTWQECFNLYNDTANEMIHYSVSNSQCQISNCTSVLLDMNSIIFRRTPSSGRSQRRHLSHSLCFN